MAKNKTTPEQLTPEQLKALQEKAEGCKRCRTWTFILYPDDVNTQELLSYLTADNIEGIRGCYIEHEAETTVDSSTLPVLYDGIDYAYDETEKTANSIEDMQCCKKHIHVMVQFYNARSMLGVQKALCLFKYDKNGLQMFADSGKPKYRKIFAVSDVHSMYIYFLHWSFRCHKEGKKPYAESDIVPLGNGSNDFIISCQATEDRQTNSTCGILLELSQNADDNRQLLEMAISDKALTNFIVKNPYFVNSFIMNRGCKK